MSDRAPSDRQEHHMKFANEDIAIVGMSCLFPKADSVTQYWENIVHKVNCITDAPADWQPELFYDPAGAKVDRSYSLKGAFLGDLCRFNPARFGVMPHSVEGAEPDHFIALRCAAEALADSGYPRVPFNHDKTGVIIGRGLFVNRGWVSVFQRTFGIDQVISVLRQLEPERSEDDLETIKTELKRRMPAGNVEAIPGLVHSAMVGRIANRLNLNGPAYTIDAACSSALIAAEAGMQKLREGTCDAVLIGGAQVSNPGPVHVIFSHLQALSRSGRIAPFSAEAQGTLLGQGCGILMLKRRSDALRDGNRIYAILKSVGTSSDGRGAGLLAPLSEGQQLAIRRCYESTEICPSTVHLLEAHGTGIPLGDQTEFATLRACFEESLEDSSVAQVGQETPVAFGSVKSMIGHLIPASGAASMIKTALALYHRVLPPTLHADEANPKLPLKDSRFYLANQVKPWLHDIQGEPRRAAVNAFGFGGINAHALMEESSGNESQVRHEQHWPTELVVISGNDRQQLISRLRRLSEWLSELNNDTIRLVDVAASCSRTLRPERVAVVAKDLPDLRKKVDAALSSLEDADCQQLPKRGGVFWYAKPLSRSGRVAFLFPGEGAQYVNMMQDLCRHFPEVRKQFDLTATALGKCGVEPPLGQILFPQPQREEQAKHDILQLESAVAAVTAAGRGLMELLDQLAIRPDAIVGHSSGEFGSLLAAGVYRPENETEIVETVIAGAESARQLAESSLVPQASLLSVGGAAARAISDVVDASDGRLVVAMDNCPHQTVLAGSETEIDQAHRKLRGKGGLCQKLEWGRAYHTSAFEPACEIIQQYYDRFTLHTPNIELWSCCTAAKYPDRAEAVSDIAVRQWRSPVRFRETIEAMHEDGIKIFVELGPRGNLTSFVSDTLVDREHAAVALDTPRANGLTQLNRALAVLIAHGVDADLNRLYEQRDPVELDFDVTPPPQPAEDPVLKLEFPVFELSPEVVESWRSGSDSRTGSEASSVALSPPDSNRSPLAASLAADVSFDTGNQHSSLTAAGDSPTDLPQNAAHTDQPEEPQPEREEAFLVAQGEPWRGAVPIEQQTEPFSAFQDTMMMFLETQKMMLAATASPDSELGLVPTPGSISRNRQRSVQPLPPVADGLIPPQPATSPAVTGIASVPPKPRWRFMDRVTRHEAGDLLVAQCQIEPITHRYLADHTFFGRDISVRDPALRSLSIMPLAMTLEIMAEAAAELCPDSEVVAISDIATMNWLTFPGHSRNIEVSAETAAAGRVRVLVSEAGEDGKPIASCVVELSRSAHPTLGPPQVEARDGNAANWNDGEVYRQILYHGPSFQGIRAVEHIGENHIRARVSPPDHDLLFHGNTARDLILPVALIDTASQLPGLANVCHSLDEPEITLAFPNTTKRLEFTPLRDMPDDLTAHVRFSQDETSLHSDVELHSADGTVLLRYAGRTEERVRFPMGLYRYQFSPEQVTCSRDITEIFRGTPGIEACRVMASENSGDRIWVNRHWAEVAAQMVLSRQEREAWLPIKEAPVRGASWLTGRMVAKDAVRSLIRSDLRMADVGISNDPVGRPIVDIVGDSTPCVSIAHRMFFAVAAASVQHGGVGVDVEPVEPVQETVWQDAFLPQETSLVPMELSAAAWTAKEAVGKALGTGVLGGPRSVVIQAVHQKSNRDIVFETGLAGPLARQFPAFSGRSSEATRLVVHTRKHDRYFVSLCLIDDLSPLDEYPNDPTNH